MTCLSEELQACEGGVGSCTARHTKEPEGTHDRGKQAYTLRPDKEGEREREVRSAMKYLDEPRLAYWSNFLGSVELGDRLLSVRTDAFSCEHMIQRTDT